MLSKILIFSYLCNYEIASNCNIFEDRAIALDFKINI